MRSAHSTIRLGEGGITVFIKCQLQRAFLKRHTYSSKRPLPFPPQAAACKKPPNLFQSIYLSKQLYPPVRKGQGGGQVRLHNDAYLIGRCLPKQLDAQALNVNRAAHLPGVIGKQKILKLIQNKTSECSVENSISQWNCLKQSIQHHT